MTEPLNLPPDSADARTSAELVDVARDFVKSSSAMGLDLPKPGSIVGLWLSTADALAAVLHEPSPTAEEILAERLTHPGRGYDAEHDEGRYPQIMAAADSYRWYFGLSLSCADDASRRALAESTKPPMIWPWDSSFWHPSPDPVRNLVKACALYAAAGDIVKRFDS